MDAQTLDRLAQLARDSGRVQVVRPPSEPAHRYFLRDGNGVLTEHEAEPPPRAHRAGDLATVARFALDFSDPADPDPDAVEVWYSRLGVTCFLDARTRRDRVWLPLEEHPCLRALRAAAGEAMDHKRFLRLLRVGLAGAVPQQLLDSVKSLSVRADAFDESAVSHGKASTCRTVEAELRGAGAIPEDVTLYLGVFASDPLPLYPVRCAVEIEPAAATLALTPLPGEVERAVRSAEADLGRAVLRLLREGRGLPDGGPPYDEPVGVFCGVP